MSRPHFHFFSPANYCQTSELEKARTIFQEQLNLTSENITPNEKWYGFANTDKNRASELAGILKNNDINWVMATKGGYGSIRCLNHLTQPPGSSPTLNGDKHIFGFSDLTVLLNHLGKLDNICCYHGPLLNFNFENSTTPPLAISSMQAWLNDEKDFTFDFNGKGFNLSQLPLEGTVVGGNLTLIASACGTPYEIDLTDKILIIEEIAEATYSIDRMLQHILLQPTARYLKGIIFGAFLSCKIEPKGCGDMPLDDIISEVATLTKLPVIKDFPLGHIKESIVLPLYSTLTLEELSKNRFRITIERLIHKNIR